MALFDTATLTLESPLLREVGRILVVSPMKAAKPDPRSQISTGRQVFSIRIAPRSALRQRAGVLCGECE